MAEQGTHEIAKANYDRRMDELQPLLEHGSYAVYNDLAGDAYHAYCEALRTSDD